MGLRKFISVLFGLFFTVSLLAQNKDELTQSRILILLDGSSSMINKWADGKEKFKAAGELILKLMDSAYTVNSQVEFSLRVFGHQHTMEENYCYDTRNEVPFARDNRLQMALRLDAIQPLGVTPIAYALQQAAEYDLTDDAHNAYSIILITDGGESCGGDICEVMRTLIKNKVYFKPYILSLENDPHLKMTYACMGDYLQVTSKEDITKAVGVIVDAFRPVLKITQADYKQLQADVAKAQPKNTDTTPVPKALKTFKTDTVISGVLPVRPVADKLSYIAPAHLLFLPVNATQDYIITILDPTGLPPLVKEAAEEAKIARMPWRQPTPLAISVPAGMPVAPFEFHTNLPSIVTEPVAKSEITGIATSRPKLLQPTTGKQILVFRNAHDVVPGFVNIGGILKKDPHAAAPAPAITQDSETVVAAVDLEPTLPVIVAQLPVAVPIKLSAITPRRQSLLPISPAVPITIITIAPDVPLPPITIEKPVAGPMKMAALPPHVQRIFPVKPNTDVELHTIQAGISLPPVLKEALPAPVVEKPAIPALTFAKLKVSAPYKFNMLIVIEERNLLYRPVPPLPPLKAEEVAKAPKSITPKPDVITVPPAKRAEIKTETEDATETTLEVYFTNGKGKFYTSTPQVVLVDPVTNKDIKSFHRFVDADGNPDPQKDIPVGTFNVTFSTKRSLVAPNVTIEKNKRNKVYITVKNTTLSFQYANAPGRPMTEFVAIVTERNKAQGRVQRQKCTEKMEYEPENYHIEINTFPKDVRNVDLNFDLETEITVLQPGFVKFTNDVKAAAVSLYQRDGDRYLPFSTFDMGDPRSGHLQIQPGEYQVHYQKGPVKSFAAEVVVSFTIRSTEVTEVILK